MKNAIKMVKQLLEEDGQGYVLKNNVKNPFPLNYKPELDVTDEIGESLALQYLQLIDIGQWAIELGWLDIFHKIALLSQYQASLREQHLEALYHIFAYLKKHPDMGCLAYDLKMPEIEETVSVSNADWKKFYRDVEEEMLRRALEPREIRKYVSIL